jgi:hypothetical protein
MAAVEVIESRSTEEERELAGPEATQGSPRLIC